MVFIRRFDGHLAARLFLRTALTWLAFAIPLFSSRAATAPNKIVISYASLSEREGVLMVARDQGFFRRQGLDVELVYMPSGPVSLAAMAHGDSQVNTGSASGAILGAMAGGLDLVFVAGLINKLTGVIVTGPNINSPADLKGKTIGVTSIGGGNWVFTMLALEHWKLDVKRDNITIRVIGSDAVRAQAITNGTIDATQISVYSLVGPLKKQGARVLADLPDLGVPYQGVTVFTRRSYLNQNPETMEKLLTAIVEAIAFIQDPANKASVLRILSKGLRLAKPEDSAEGYESVKPHFERKIYPTVEGVRNTIRLLGMSNEKIRNLRPEEIIDDRIVRRLEQKGLFR
ncbi:MAG: ABC transporter substrate-binding protein [Deltaproteobacteria bacterium]|nr:ABC transporter substrate-binding protein [Deltaproteobacteria bacterium]